MLGVGLCRLRVVGRACAAGKQPGQQNSRPAYKAKAAVHLTSPRRKRELSPASAGAFTQGRMGPSRADFEPACLRRAQSNGWAGRAQSAACRFFIEAGGVRCVMGIGDRRHLTGTCNRLISRLFVLWRGRVAAWSRVVAWSPVLWHGLPCCGVVSRPRHRVVAWSPDHPCCGVVSRPRHRVVAWSPDHATLLDRRSLLWHGLPTTPLCSTACCGMVSRPRHFARPKVSHLCRVANGRPSVAACETVRRPFHNRVVAWSPDHPCCGVVSDHAIARPPLWHGLPTTPLCSTEGLPSLSRRERETFGRGM